MPTTRALFLFFLLSCTHPDETKKPEETKSEPAATKPKSTGCDMSSDEAVRKVYLQLARKQLRKEDCVERPSSFPELARVGTYASDLGCKFDTYIFQCNLITLADAAPKAMASAGWVGGSQEKKQELAVAWLVQIEDLHPLTEKDTQDVENFKAQGKRLPPPESEATPDGGLKLRYWLRLDSGGTRFNKEVLYKRHETLFDANGVKTGGTVLSSFSHKPS